MLKPVNNASFSPVPGNLDTFLSSVQQVHVPEEPEQPEVPAEDPEEPLDFGGEDSDDSERKTVPTNTGKALARLVDRGWAFGAGLYAHAPSEKYRSTQAEIGELEDAFADFVEETGINISPAVNLIIAIIAIYAFRVGDVVRDRKINLEKEAAEAAAVPAADSKPAIPAPAPASAPEPEKKE